MSGIIGASPNMRSGVVGAFTTGQVIQTAYRTYGTNSSTVAGSTLTKALHSTVAQYYVTIDNVDANNNVYIIMTTALYKFSNNWSNCESGAGIFRGTDNIYQTSQYANSMRWRSTGHQANDESNDLCTIHYVDETPAAGSNTYFLGIRSADVNNTVNVNNGTSTFTAMEIKG